ncbi:MAG TPA: 5-deoxy-glucuronate isomerase [Chloroflexota bacterium]|nr:5-deoxy-glucuronate isomerase [Chloroflexota bacterium]
MVVRAGTPVDSHRLLSISQGDAAWSYVSFQIWQLESGDRVEDSTGREEVGLVLLSGRLSVVSPQGEWTDLGSRKSVFEGNPWVLYLPPGTDFSAATECGCTVARAGALAEQGPRAYVIRPDEIAVETRGQGNAQRQIRHLLEADRTAVSLFLVECITPGGHWSSYPPHKHDIADPPREAYLEEIYYHLLKPSQGFGFQRIYTPEGDLDEAVVIRDGTLVTVPRGYHPVTVAPGYDLYYLNVMAGPTRAWRFTDDPDHAWVSAGWRPYGAESGNS